MRPRDLADGTMHALARPGDVPGDPLTPPTLRAHDWKYLQVAAIREQVVDGALVRGQPIPAISKLRRCTGCSHAMAARDLRS
jgi:hypothetical protein